MGITLCAFGLVFIGFVIGFLLCSLLSCKGQARDE